MSGLSAKAKNGKISALAIVTQKILDKAAAEDRDLTEAEGLKCDEIFAQIDELEFQIQLEQRNITQQTGTQGTTMTSTQFSNKAKAAIDALAIPGTRIPAQARKHNNLKCFRGPDAEQKAYDAGKFYQAALLGDIEATEYCQTNNLWMAHRTTDNNRGGVLVPSPVSTEIINLQEEIGVFRQFSFNWPMSSDTLTIPRRIGGLTAYYTAETDTIATSPDIEMNTVHLTARKLAVMTAVTSELNEDSLVVVADLISAEIARAFSDKEDAAGFKGDGTSTYGGITGLKNALNAGAIVTAAAGNTSFGSLDLNDFEKCAGALAQYPGIQPRWYIHSAGYFASMGRLMNAAGGNTTRELADGPQRMFLGYPVQFTQVLPNTLAAQPGTIVAYFGDLQMGSTFGNRRDHRIATDAGKYFSEDMIAIRGTERFDIKIHDTGDADSAGSIVALQTPSS